MWKLTFVIFLFLFSSCDSLSWKSPENKVAELEELLEVSTASFHKVDSIWLQEKFDRVNENIEELKKLNINDSLPLFAEYKILKEALKEFMKARPVLGEEMYFCKLQLSNLKADIANGYLNNEEFEKHLNIEKRVVNRICTKIDIYYSGFINLKTKYKTLNPEVNILIDSLIKN
jgi:hypothetical protein